MNPQIEIEKQKVKIAWWQVVIATAAVIGPLIALITYLNNQSPKITITNHLSSKVDITINGAYSGQVGPKSSRTFDLLTASSFPATVEWEVIRQENDQDHPISSIMKDSIKAVDNGKNIPITNITKSKKFYFAPVLSNNTDLSCKITVNKDRKNGIEKPAGYLKPYQKNVFLGYYEWIAASNVVLECGPDGKQGYYWGDFQGKIKPGIRPQATTGLTYLTFFIEENQ